MNNAESAVAIFDSGIGGLTAVREFIKIAPNENIVYFGDTGRLPYGGRTAKAITKYALQDISFLLSHDIKLIIAACGTVTSTLSEKYTSQLPVPYMNILRPSVLAAAKATRNNRVGLIGTAATVRSGAYVREFARTKPEAQVFQNACPLFVPLIENAWVARDCNVTIEVAKTYLAPIMEQGVDTLILACTHYPIIRDIIADIMGAGVTLIDASCETARAALRYLDENGILNTDGGARKFFVSDDVEGFTQNAEMFLGTRVNGDVYLTDVSEMEPAVSM